MATNRDTLLLQSILHGSLAPPVLCSRPCTSTQAPVYQATAAAGPPLLSCSTAATCAGTPQAHQSCQEQARSALDPYTPRSSLSSLYLPMILSTYQRSLWEKWEGLSLVPSPVDRVHHEEVPLPRTPCCSIDNLQEQKKLAPTPTHPRSVMPSRQCWSRDLAQKGSKLLLLLASKCRSASDATSLPYIDARQRLPADAWPRAREWSSTLQSAELQISTLSGGR